MDKCRSGDGEATDVLPRPRLRLLWPWVTLAAALVPPVRPALEWAVAYGWAAATGRGIVFLPRPKGPPPPPGAAVVIEQDGREVARLGGWPPFRLVPPGRYAVRAGLPLAVETADGGDEFDLAPRGVVVLRGTNLAGPPP